MTSKKIALGLAIISVLLLGGCYVQSIYPYYTDKDLFFDDNLIGSWHEAGDTNEAWTFEKNGELAYKINMKEDSHTNLLSGHLFKLNKHEFLDCVYQMKPDDSVVEAHHLVIVQQISPNFKFALLNVDGLRALLKKNPGALRHLSQAEVQSGDHPIVLTANTAELQAFLIRHATDTNLFPKTVTMEKMDSAKK